MNLIKAILLCAALMGFTGCRYDSCNLPRQVPPFSESRADLPGALYKGKLRNVTKLDEMGSLALFAGETVEDTVRNEKAKKNEPADRCNSLFLRRIKRDGSKEWRLLLTTGSKWNNPHNAGEWGLGQDEMINSCFEVFRASFASDKRHLWIVCNPHTYTFTDVCSYDALNNTFRVICDGDTAEAQSDGTILVKNKKTYLYDKNGESLGAAWYNEWITPDGKVVKKTKPRRSLN